MCESLEFLSCGLLEIYSSILVTYLYNTLQGLAIYNIV
jgi:hypothetical protein